MFIVILSSCGNPDFRQSAASQLSPTQRIEVNTLGDASKACRTYIEEWDLGGGNWSGGQVLKDGKQIAKVSYNGRVWNNRGNEILPEELQCKACKAWNTDGAFRRAYTDGTGFRLVCPACGVWNAGVLNHRLPR